MDRKTKNKEWVKAEVEELIDQYELHPVLWDVKSEDYYNRLKKTEAFSTIAAKFNTTKGEIIRKIHNLRNQFNSELKKEKLRNAGQVTEELYVSKWVHYSKLKFLTSESEARASITQSGTSSSEKTNIDESYNNDQSQIKMSTKPRIATNEEINVDENYNNEHSEIRASTKSKTTSNEKVNVDDIYNNEHPQIKISTKPKTIRSTPYSTRKRDTQNFGNLFSKAVKTLSTEEDAHTVFGSHVANELRSLKNNTLIRLLKKKIQLAIIEVNDMLDNMPNCSTSSTLHDWTPSPTDDTSQSSSHQNDEIRWKNF